MNYFKKKVLILIIFPSCLAFIFGYFFEIKKIQVQTAHDKKELLRLSKKLKTIKNKIDNTKEAISKLTKNQRIHKDISKLKQEVNTSKLIDYLSYLSQKYDIKLENFKPISSIKKTGIVKMIIGLCIFFSCSKNYFVSL